MTRIVVNPGYRIRDSARGRDAEAGEILDVSEKEGRVLLALRRASLAPAEPVTEQSAPAPEPAPAPEQPAPAEAEPVEPMSTETSDAIVPPRRGRYMRRDERAEGK